MFPLTLPEIKVTAAPHDYQRGLEYAGDGSVQIISIGAGEVKARVQGTRNKPYKITLTKQEKQLDGDCSCPAYGEFSYFCKHMVAVALTVIKEYNDYSLAGKTGNTSAGTTKQSNQATIKITPVEKIRQYLSSMSSAQLTDLIISQAERDDRLFKSLLLKAESNKSGGFNIEALRKTVRNVVRIPDFLEYGETEDYADGLFDIIETLEQALKNGYAPAVKELVEEIFEELEEALNSMDDSEGCTAEPIEKLQELHVKACLLAKTHPTELAKFLFYNELDDGWGFFYGSLERYKDTLGAEGIAAYGDLVRQAWEALPELSPNKNHIWDSRRNMLEKMMAEFASNNLDVLVSIKSKNLSRPDKFAEIAELYNQNKKYDKALEWALKGIKAFKNEPSYLGRLIEMACGLHNKKKEHAKEAELYWWYFEHTMHFETYLDLKKSSVKYGNWEEYRNKATKLLVRDSEKRQRSARPVYSSWGNYQHRPDNASLLVKISVHEKEYIEALGYAQKYGCSKSLWLELADNIVATHTQAAISIYQEQIGELIKQTNNNSYNDAIKLITKLQEFYEEYDNGENFFLYIETLKGEFKAKRNMMKLLEEVV